MKSKLIYISILALAGVLSANAQYTFTINVSWSGNCYGYTSVMNQAVSQFQSQAINGFPTRELCEQTRAMCHQELGHIELIYTDPQTGKVIKRESTNCKLNVVTTPCTGRPLAGSGNAGTINMQGVNEGSSFFTPSNVTEIQNWDEDYMRKVTGLDQNYQSVERNTILSSDANFNSARDRLRSEGGWFIDPDKPFVPINMREGGTNTIVSKDLITPRIVPADKELIDTYLANVDWENMPHFPNITTEGYISWIQDQFSKTSGHDISEIMKKFERTPEEDEIYRNYREFEVSLIEEGQKQLSELQGVLDRTTAKKEVDMSILALDCYGNDDKGYLYNTDYKQVDLNNVPLDDPMRELASKLIESNNKFTTGFNAVLYYNDKTNEYTLAFEGSAMLGVGLSSQETFASAIAPSIDYDMEAKEYVINAAGWEVRIPQDMYNDWGENNAKQAVGMIAEQFLIAKEIGDLINSNPALKDTNINFTGHSLGGGLASVAGLSTGRPTYTYNAEGVSDKILENFGLLEKKQNGDFNITRYHTDNDILTNAQEYSQNNDLSNLVDPSNSHNNYGATAIGNEVNVGNLNTVKDDLIAVGAGAVTLLVTKKPDWSLKAAEYTSKALAHRMGPMVDHFMDQHKTAQNKWSEYHSNINALSDQQNRTYMRSLEQIYITTE